LVLLRDILINKKQELMDFIKEKGIVVSDKELILSSGEKTHFYYDEKKVALYPKGVRMGF